MHVVVVVVVFQSCLKDKITILCLELSVRCDYWLFVKPTPWIIWVSISLPYEMSHRGEDKNKLCVEFTIYRIWIIILYVR